MKIYIGFCKGGPLAGRRHQSPGPYFNAVIPPKLTFAAMMPSVNAKSTVSYGRYIWNGHGEWLWENDNGGNRRAPPAAQSNPPDPTDQGNAGTIPFLTSPNPFSFDIAPEPTLEDAGIRAGEIIGERMWLVSDQHLRSLSADFIWHRGMTVYGDVNSTIHVYYDPRTRSVKKLKGGVYAYFPLSKQLLAEWLDLSMTTFPVFCHGEPIIGIARGTVALWGEVIEHEGGYRAEFAKMLTIDDYDGRPEGRKVIDYYRSAL